MLAGLGILGISILLFVFAVVQIQLFKALPVKWQYMVSCNVFLATIMNFAASSVMLLFTGVGSLVGILNLGGSVLFGFWIVGFCKYHKCRLEWEWYKIKVGKLFSIKLFPYPKGKADNPSPYWLF